MDKIKTVHRTTTVNHINVDLAEKTKLEIDKLSKTFRDAQREDDERRSKLRQSNAKSHFKWFGLRS